MPFGLPNPVAGMDWLGRLMNNLVHGGSSSRVTAPAAPTIGQGQTAYHSTVLGPKPKTPQQQMNDKLAALRALAAQSGNIGMPSAGSMSTQAANAAALTYDPQIAALKRAMGLAKDTTATQQKLAKSTYSDLAGTYKADVNTAKKDAQYFRELEKARAQDYKSEIKNNYTDSMHNITSQLEQLGIQSAGGEVLGDLQHDMATYQSLGAQDTATQQGAINERAAGDTQYYRKGATVANLAGAEQVSQLGTTLQRYLLEQQGKMGQLEAQKQLAYQSSLTSIQNSAAKAYNSAQNDSWNKLLQISKLEQSNNATKKFGNGLTGASNYLAEQFTNSQWGPNEGKRYLGILQGLINQIGSRGQQLTPEQMMYESVQAANRQGISPSVLQRAMAAYLGKG